MWWCEQALEVGLVDELGGFVTAVARMKRLLGVPAGIEALFFFLWT